MDFNLLSVFTNLAISLRCLRVLKLFSILALVGGASNACPQSLRNSEHGELFDIISCGDLLELERYADKGGDIDSLRYGNTALWSTIVDGRLDVAKRLISLGADVNVGEDAPITALIGSLRELSEANSDSAVLNLVRDFSNAGANFDILGAAGNHLLISFVSETCETPSLGTIEDRRALAQQLRPHRVSLTENDLKALVHIRTLSDLGIYDKDCVAELIGGPIRDG